MTMTATTMVDDHDDGDDHDCDDDDFFSPHEALTATFRCKSAQIYARQEIGDNREMNRIEDDRG